MDVKTRYWADYESVEELRALLSDPRFTNLPKLAVGGGSNLLFKGDYEGLILHSAIRSIDASVQTDGSILVRSGSGVCWDDLVSHCVEQGWSGLENLSGIPGEVGASPVQNIGAYGAEAKDCIESVRALDVRTLELKTFSNLDCRFGYRDSIFKNELKNCFIVCYVTYRLSSIFTPNTKYGDINKSMEALGGVNLQNVRKAVLEIRNSKLPDCDVLGNAGSFFMNPELPAELYKNVSAKWPEIPAWPLPDGRVKVSAAWCIEKAGWKGRKLGNAGVHEHQSLVLVNLGGATAAEIMALCDRIISDVQTLFGITLQPEVLLV